MKFNKLLIILSITVAIFIGILFGASYAWYAYKNAQTSVSGQAIKTTPTVIFAQTEYIFSGNTMPINDEDKYNYANKSSFTVTLNENLREYQTGIKIVLQDLKISPELRIPNYKYELLQDGAVISQGDFSTVGNSNELQLMPMTILNPTNYPQTYTYELYIWLSDDGSVQNDLMNKGISAKIGVISAEKK